MFSETFTYRGQTYVQSHGNPFDRGAADSYYGRRRDPHHWPEGTHRGTRIEASDMSPSEIEAYHAGYSFNEELGSKKDWGHDDINPDQENPDD